MFNHQNLQETDHPSTSLPWVVQDSVTHGGSQAAQTPTSNGVLPGLPIVWSVNNLWMDTDMATGQALYGKVLTNIPPKLVH